ncbi:hypothetical protein HK103_006231 [Boothiomyces macroporosus]|uniref:Uncharacterized protein n=1 Tax=Boothiomyces macroporosus TaxID=261099 RepID=A0AAD5UH59_9FUNG|nr:hypothetical protein HK103_006231 [Boothiomyces macroporosus]
MKVFAIPKLTIVLAIAITSLLLLCVNTFAMPPEIVEQKEFAVHSFYERKIVGPFDFDFTLIGKQILDKHAGLGIMRYGDGELAVIQKQPLVAEQDNWKYNGGDDSVLAKDLSRTLSGHYGEPLYYGFPANENVESLNTYLNLTQQSLNYVTYANLFVNSNYKRTRKLLEMIQNGDAGDVVLFASKESRLHASTFTTMKEYVECPDEGLQWYETNHKSIKKTWDHLAAKYTNTLFVLSCGPLSNIAVHRMWGLNKFNRYIDFGSSVDEILKGRRTRPYMDDSSEYAGFFDPAFKVVDGSAILLPNLFTKD